MKRTIRISLSLTLAASVVTAILMSGENAVPTVSAKKPETRCGWFHNPTPGNAWLIDRDGEWIIGIQGDYQADGDWPSFSKARWVRTNVNYGYG